MKISPSGRLLGAFLALTLAAGARAELADIPNYREYSEQFASAGQPSEDQLAEVRDAGFERVVYIAFSNSGDALPEEDQIVRDLGMDYVHIPVVWNEPRADDFGSFAAIMQQAPDRKTLLHCQVNFRASAFSFLYRVLYEDVPVAEAKADMNSVWEPNEIWRDFIFGVLESHGVSPDCPGCSWEVSE